MFWDFVERHGPRRVCAHDFDADGVAAGAIWERCVGGVRWVPGRVRDAWRNREALRALEPDALFVLDLGCRSEKLLEGVPTCFVDHHRPEPPPEGDLLITGYGAAPPTCTAAMMWDLAGRPAELGWVAALGILSDLGPKAPFEVLREAREQHGVTALDKAVTLVNAARRCSRPMAEVAARAVLAASGPREFLRGAHAAALKEAHEEVKRELSLAKRAAPKFAGPVALLRVSSPCQVHPILAQIWRTRLPKYHVLVANDAFEAGRVHVSARSTPPLKVLDLLDRLRPLAPSSDLGRGHDHASGGSLDAAEWAAVLRELGFS